MFILPQSFASLQCLLSLCMLAIAVGADTKLSHSKKEILATGLEQKGQTISGDVPGGYYGIETAISADGSTLAIGAPGDNDGLGLDRSYAKVFKYRGNKKGWVQLGTTFVAEAAADALGWSVSLSDDGKTFALGTKLEDIDDLLNRGSAQVFTYSCGEWSLKGSKIDGISEFDLSGRTVSLSSDGNTLLSVSLGAGASVNTVRVFDFVNGDWVQRGADVVGADDSGFGFSANLSGDGNTFIVGVLFHD
eukprot:CAMPEP_0117517220 /NCGR_PEP_ID=MMETSP0784-20121206/31500_1 /TAXON_ID=39447 /ORGANISM="" /LENGTH=247 /DNA_ID=CAMNT_0005313095 /DNA_START=50 /DNA_END=790 /DNA_ORIENTATION=-